MSYMILLSLHGPGLLETWEFPYATLTTLAEFNELYQCLDVGLTTVLGSEHPSLLLV